MNQFTNDLSLEIYEHTYKYGDETLETTQKRIAKDIASKEEDKELWTNKFLYALENFKFVPGGRIISNAGTNIRGTTYVNCFVDGFVGKNQDSVSGILEALRRQAFILKSEGGYGFCADVMRPRGGYIEGIANDTPGAVKWLDNWNTQSDVITAGSGRRSENKKAKQKIRKGAQMVTMSCWHPDIEEYITAKQTSGKLDKFNMSVLITDEFMDAIINNKKWDLIFPDFDKVKEVYNDTWDGNIKKWIDNGGPVKVYKTFKDANELWNLILTSTYNRNEPGVLFVDVMNRLNNLSYCEYISATNPCLAGNTIIAVADGRNGVSIKQLAEEGKDVPVYCLDKYGELDIKTMRNPRITGFNQQIYKINIENGHFIRVTGNHKFRFKDGRYVEARDLKNGDSLHLLTKYEDSIKEIFPKANSRSSDYFWLNNGDFKSNKSEHRFIYEKLNEEKIKEGNIIHHKDFNSLNNSIDNLIKIEHDKLIEKDPRLIKTYKKALENGYETKIENNEVLVEKKCEICGENFWTKYFTREVSFCSTKCSTQYLNTNEEIKKKRQKNSNEYYDNNSVTNKIKQLDVFTKMRLDLNRDPFLKEWKDCCSENNIPYRLNTKRGFKNFKKLKEEAEVYNHRVISIELDGIEDVYNGTVDEFHNFFAGGFIEKTKNGKNKYLYINQLQCGEQILPIGGVCLLGNLNLTQFINDKRDDWDYDKLGEIIPIAIRFMDNVNDLTYVPLQDQKDNLINKRRIGLGILGYGSSLLIMKKRYGNQEALDITEKLMNFIANKSYQASALLANEKGSFLLFDLDKYMESNYLKVLSEETREMIRKYGIRNSHLLSIQPTGNSSILSNVASGGLEPVFLFEYIRTVIQPYPPQGLQLPENIDWNTLIFGIPGSNGKHQEWKWVKEGDENMLKTEFNGVVYKFDRGRGLLKESLVKDYGVKLLEDLGEWDPTANWAANINNLKISEHIQTMRTISKYIDSSMSKCIAEGTLITTNKGIMPIESISSNRIQDTFSDSIDQYKILDENGNLKKITSHYFGGEKECYKVRFNNGFEIDLAYTHKLKTENGWKSVLELKKDDIIFYRNNKTENNNKYIELKNKPIFTNRHIKYEHPTFIDEDYAKFIGMFLSDGSINKNTIGIIEKNEKVNEEINRLFKKLFKVEPKITIDKKSNVKLHSLNSRPLAKFYKNFIGFNDLTKDIPEEILYSNDEVKKSFISGLCLDGYIKEDNNLVVYCGYSKNIAVKTTYILSSLGYEFHLQEKKVYDGRLSKKMYTVKSYLTSKETEPAEEHKIEYSISGKKNKQIFVEDKEKYKILPDTHNDNYFLFRNFRKSFKSSSFTKKHLLDELNIEYDDNLTCVKIIDIKNIGKRRVYDIEVEDTHSYLINGIVSHNTINLPNDYKFDDFKNVYLDLYKSGTIKGGTTYRAGTMASVIKKKDDDVVVSENNAPKRPKILDCDVIRFTNKGDKWIGFIGLIKGAPYEIFTGLAESFVIPAWIEKGQIRKEKVKNKEGVLVSRYDFIYVDKEGYEVIMTGLNRSFAREYWNIGKMTSALLRHHIHLPSVVGIIESLNLDGDTMGTWKKGITRMLKRYIKENKGNGENSCPNCGSTNLVYKENCISCLDCQWSKCE